MHLTDDEKQLLLKQGYGPGHRHYVCCQMCGYLEWRMTQKDRTDDVTVQEGDCDYQCPRCTDVFRRNPEIFRWVTGVLGYRDRKAKP